MTGKVAEGKSKGDSIISEEVRGRAVGGVGNSTKMVGQIQIGVSDQVEEEWSFGTLKIRDELESRRLEIKMRGGTVVVSNVKVQGMIMRVGC